MGSKNRFLYFALILLGVKAFGQNPGHKDFIQHLKGTPLKIEMVAIPAGSFIMGSALSEAGVKEDEGPQHKVRLDAFWMSKHEVTWELYQLFVNRVLDTVPQDHRSNQINAEVDAVAGATVPYVDMSLGMGTDPGLPVGNVTQKAASTFCEWLSALTGHFYRLPTEAEWEYAARAGSSTTYYFGNNAKDLNDHAWHYGNSQGTYHAIGQKKPNPWGLYDVYGNVAEWTLDQYVENTYKGRTTLQENPLVVPTTTYPRTVRGGSYDDDPEALRSAGRRASSENWKMRDPQFPKSQWWNTDAPFVGFRIVRHATRPTAEEIRRYWVHKNND